MVSYEVPTSVTTPLAVCRSDSHSELPQNQSMIVALKLQAPSSPPMPIDSTARWVQAQRLSLQSLVQHVHCPQVQRR